MLKALVNCVKTAGLSCGRRGRRNEISRIVVEEIQQGKGNTKRHSSEPESVLVRKNVAFNEIGVTDGSEHLEK